MSFTLQSRRHIVVERVNTFVFLGLWIQNDLKWNTDISKITKRTNKLFTLIRECRKSSLYARSEFGLLTYTTNTAILLEYVLRQCGTESQNILKKKLKRVQQRCPYRRKETHYPLKEKRVSNVK